MDIDNTLQQAQDAYQRKDLETAERLYQSVVDADGSHEEALFMRAMIAQAREDWDTAAQFMHRVLNVNPGNATHHFTYGQIQMRRGDFDRAYAGLSKAVELDPNYLAAHASLGYTELRRGNWAAAEKQLRLALKVEQDNPQLLVYLGMALMEQGEAGKAISYLEHAVKLKPEQGLAHYHLGRAMLANGQAAFAIQCFDNALDKLPKIAAEVLLQRGQAEEASGQMDKAVATYHQALEAPGRSPGAVAALARLYRLSVHPDAAEQILRDHPVPAGQFEAIELEWAEVLLAQNRPRAAAKRLQPLPDNASRSRRVLLAKALYADNQLQAALDALAPDELAEDDPDHVQSRTLHARILHALDKPAAAEKILDQLLQRAPKPVDAVLLRAERLVRTAQADDAVALLESAAAHGDRLPIHRQAIMRALGDAHYSHGDVEAAVEAWGQQMPVPALMTQLDEEPLPTWTYDDPDFEEDAESAMQANAVGDWPSLAPARRAMAPIFIHAWPGAGRGRLLKALAVHPQLHVVNDGLLMQKPRRQLITTPQGAVALGQINQEALNQTHRRYRQMLLAAGPSWSADSQLVDGLAFTAAGLPAISLYFPGAAVIMVEADSDQLKLAWQRLGVRVDNDLEQRIDREQRQLEQCRAVLDLQWLPLSLRELTQNPAEALNRLCEQLGVEESAEARERLSRIRSPLFR